MKPREIVADPLRLFEMGLRNLTDMAALVHIGRCGLVGAKRTSLATVMKCSYETARSSVDRLEDLGLITSVSRDMRQGLPMNYVCTVKGWNLLTTPADFSMFPHAQMALEKRRRAKK